MVPPAISGAQRIQRQNSPRFKEIWRKSPIPAAPRPVNCLSCILPQKPKNPARAGSVEACCKVNWRRGRDSNPRYACTHNGFRDRPIKPLWHPSEGSPRDERVMSNHPGRGLQAASAACMVPFPGRCGMPVSGWRGGSEAGAGSGCGRARLHCPHTSDSAVDIRKPIGIVRASPDDRNRREALSYARTAGSGKSLGKGLAGAAVKVDGTASRIISFVSDIRRLVPCSQSSRPAVSSIKWPRTT